MYVSVGDFVCITLFSPFVLGFYPSIYFFNSKIYFLNNYLLFFMFYFNNFILFYLILFYPLSFFLSIFVPFIGSRVDERLLVLQPGIRAVPLSWESQLQDTGPQETSQIHVTPNGENLPEISISTPRHSFTQ